VTSPTDPSADPQPAAASGTAPSHTAVHDQAGTATYLARARAAHRGNDPRAGIRAYCAGNVWLEANAKAVGNWQAPAPPRLQRSHHDPN
jgi:hypothetical protein